MALSAFFLAICLLTFSQSSGSVVDVAASPGSIKPYMTPRLVLSCMVNDTSPNVAGSLVGRDVTPAPVSSTVDNVALVTSLTILKKDHGTIATVTIATPAAIVGHLNNASVSGDVKGSNGVRGHLDMTFDDPTEVVEGTYTCEVNALNSLGHNIVLQKSVRITTDDPSLSEVIKHMYSLELKNRDMSTALNQAQSQISHQATLNTQQASQISQLTAQNTQQSSLITDLQHKLALVNDTSRHVEVYEAYCDEGDFPNGGGTRSKSCSYSFSQAYDTPPAVMVSPVKIRSINDRDDTSYQIEITSISTTGFTVKTSAFDNSKLDDLKIRWMSVAR